MAAYHASPGPDLTQMQSLADLTAFLTRPRAARATFEQFEHELGTLTRRLEAEVLAVELARYDVEGPVIAVHGTVFRRCLADEPKTYLTAAGPVTVARTLFRPEGGGKAICPLELRAGLIGVCTPRLARQICFVMGHLTSQETATVFRELGVEGPSASTCDRIPKRLDPVWEAHREDFEATLRTQETVPAAATIVAVSLDGVLVPDKTAQREAKAARDAVAAQGLRPPATGPAGYREVGCGTVTLYAPRDTPARDASETGPVRLETVRHARAPEYKKATLTAELDAELDAILIARPDLRVVALADGADENWRYFEGPRWVDAIQIVDHGHAAQHLKAACLAGYGDTVEGRAEYERLRILLRDKPGGVDEVLAELRRWDRRLRVQHAPRRRSRLAKERTYFRNQRARMDYAGYQAQGLPIGSGVVEAACKTLATQRLKRSGMNWGDGKQPILTIRSLQQSERWDRGWKLLAATFRQQVSRVTERSHLRCIEPLRVAA
jgi:hypothetical protein